MLQFDRRELYTSLKARIRYLHAFLDFGEDDVTTLRNSQKYLKEMIPDLVDEIYLKLLRYDITARVFSTHDSRDENEPEEWLRKGDPQFNNRKMFLRWYFIRLISNAGDMAYWEYLDKVGLLHIKQGKQQGVFVDYILLGSCLGFIQGSVTEKLMRHPKLDMETKIAAMKTFNKIIWIQNDLLARYHVQEPELVSKENGMVTEVPLNLIKEQPPRRNNEDSHMRPSRCPFGGVSQKLSCSETIA
eukprot:TRINITY_DN6932_c0_g1_i1.p1 TRINITY_DN6932_c0_g1~~TRINITY_DN6932_c0_g1_i1.p1  ORF type:complete len:244 (-),score=-0.10 TRINITY_DN6932_c0_g1_i1:146-877(-)